MTDARLSAMICMKSTTFGTRTSTAVLFRLGWRGDNPETFYPFGPSLASSNILNDPNHCSLRTGPALSAIIGVILVQFWRLCPPVRAGQLTPSIAVALF